MNNYTLNVGSSNLITFTPLQPLPKLIFVAECILSSFHLKDLNGGYTISASNFYTLI
jgi:hypothetical protein